MSIALLLTVLRRRWVVVAIGALLGLLLGVGMTKLMPASYSATASLVVSPVVTNPLSGAREDVNIRTEQEILGSREVAARASEILGIPADRDSFLLTQADVAAPSGSQVLQITVQSASPQQAADAANALSQAYLEFRREGADATIQQYLDRIDAQLASLEAEGAGSDTLQLIAVLQEQRLNLALTGVEPGRIIGYAEPPSSPSTPGMMILLPGGLAVGVLLGVVGAIAVERLDRRVRTGDRLARAVGGVEIVEDKDSARFWSTLGDEALLALGTASRDFLASGVRVLLTQVGARRDDAVARLRDGVESAIRDVVEIEAFAGRGVSSGAASPDGAATTTALPGAAGADGEPEVTTPPLGIALDDEPDETSDDPDHPGRHVDANGPSAAGAGPAPVIIADASTITSAGRLERRAAVSDVSVVVLSGTANLRLAADTIAVLREAGGPVVVGLRR